MEGLIPADAFGPGHSMFGELKCRTIDVIADSARLTVND